MPSAPGVRTIYLAALQVKERPCAQGNIFTQTTQAPATVFLAPVERSSVRFFRESVFGITICELWNRFLVEPRLPNGLE